MRVLFIQHGDYREAVSRFERGEDETYYAQRYSVEAVAQLRELAQDVVVLCLSAGPYDEPLSNGIRAAGLPIRNAGRRGRSALLDKIACLDPTHVVARLPSVEILRWCIRLGVRVLPMLADSFPEGMRSWLGNRRLTSALRHPGVRWVGNHNRPAARALVRMGVPAGKVIPWDWPPVATPEQEPVREAPSCGATWQLLFVGRLEPAKGAQDVVEAVARLAGDGLKVGLSIVGQGERHGLERLAARSRVTSHLRFLGRIGHGEVRQLMRSHHVMVVPSRSESPEGLPFTIYDALGARLPLIASDHPMFLHHVRHERSGLVYRAGDPEALAAAIRRLMEEPELYRGLSERSPQAFRELECPAKWDEVIRRWLRDGPEDREWLSRMTLSRDGTTPRLAQ